MNFLPMNRLGPHINSTIAEFGIFLPGIAPPRFSLEVRVIHENDQFIQTEPAFKKKLQHSYDSVYGDFWGVSIDISKPGSGRSWGKKGKYIYRYCLQKPDGSELDWIVDPFAREFGVGRHAAFTYDYKSYTWSANEAKWKTPRHHDLVLYEINVMEFAGTMAKAIERLDYLQDLGINCLSLMPITNISDAIDWGYTPVGYFGVDERFGKRYDFQEFVDRAHQRGIAVLVDAIYGHTSSLFAYDYLYNQTDVPNPIMGSFSQDMFGASVDWRLTFAQDFFYTVNRHWLEVYHIDGFRYDCVPNYWELGPNFRGYAQIAYNTYQFVKSQISAGDPLYKRFDDGSNPLRLIQCAEQLEAVKTVLEQTYTSCCWQNKTLSAAVDVAKGASGALVNFGMSLGGNDLPVEVNCNNDRIYKSPLQYIENHDQNRFICNFGTYNPDYNGNSLFEKGDRSQWYRMQPYLIAILMSKGIPLLWQGQELCENATIAAGGTSRTGFLRIIHWEYFYDKEGKGVLSLVRKLLKVRQQLTHVRNGEHFFFNNNEQYHNNGVMLFARYYPNTPTYSLIALNFTDTTRWIPFWFPIAGNYKEELNGTSNDNLNLKNVQAYSEYMLEIPSNYGRIWTHTY